MSNPTLHLYCKFIACVCSSNLKSLKINRWLVNDKTLCKKGKAGDCIVKFNINL